MGIMIFANSKGLGEPTQYRQHFVVCPKFDEGSPLMKANNKSSGETARISRFVGLSFAVCTCRKAIIFINVAHFINVRLKS